VIDLLCKAGTLEHWNIGLCLKSPVCPKTQKLAQKVVSAKMPTVALRTPKDSYKLLKKTFIKDVKSPANRAGP
jgi:hypothetical protein